MELVFLLVSWQLSETSVVGGRHDDGLGMGCITACCLLFCRVFTPWCANRCSL